MSNVSAHTYAEIDGFRPLRLDLRKPTRPAGVRPPVVVWIHGGAWRNGSREFAPPTLARLFPMLAEAGFAVASVDYRLSGEAVYPAQLDDVRAAVGWLRANAGDLGIDTDRLAVWGESAGGHLASLFALTTGPDDRPRCAVAFYPPVDLTSRWAHGSADTPEALLIGGRPQDLPDAARAASPVTFVHAAAPPMLLLHGDADIAVPISQSELLAERLRAVGAPVVFEPVPGAGHVFSGHPDPALLIARAIEFTAAEFTAAGTLDH